MVSNTWGLGESYSTMSEKQEYHDLLLYIIRGLQGQVKRLEERLASLEERLSNEEKMNLKQRTQLGVWVVVIGSLLAGGANLVWSMVEDAITVPPAEEARDE